jgi:hypothetical protein
MEPRMSRADKFTFHDKDLVFGNPRRWNPGDEVQIVDQPDNVARVIETFYDGTRQEHRVKIDFGERWINCSRDPQMSGCADTDEPHHGDAVAVHDTKGLHQILDVRKEDWGYDVLVDLGPQWYSEDDVETP